MQKVTVMCPTSQMAQALGLRLYKAGFVVAWYPYRGTEVLTTDAPLTLVNTVCREISGGAS
jgi:hypothetical protein